MLTKSEIFKELQKKVNLTVNNSITLSDEINDEKLGKGRKFTSRFIESGIVHYKEFGDVLITKETLDKFIDTMVGCPVIINHKDINENNVKAERVGVVSRVWYNEDDGWYYCEGIIWDKDAIELIKKYGWNVSCSYDFESDFESKTHNGKKIDMEFTDGNFLHLALVETPRYERANIVVNSKDTVNNWVEPENIDYWFSTKTGVKIPVAKGQSKEDALKSFVKEKTEESFKRNKTKNEAWGILYSTFGKDLGYNSESAFKRNVLSPKKEQELRNLIETSSDKIRGVRINPDSWFYHHLESFAEDNDYYNNSTSPDEFLHDLLSGVKTGEFDDRKYNPDYDPYADMYDEEAEAEYQKQQAEIKEKMDKLTLSYYDEIEKGNFDNFDKVTEQIAKIYGIDKSEIEDIEYIWRDFYGRLDKIEEDRTKVNNESESRKENVIMSALNDLENFVRGIVENACKDEKEEIKEELKVENEDKRKLIDEIGGILKGKVDEEIIRTVLGKAEKLAYEKSEDGTADNKCKNGKEEEKEEKYEEEKEIAENEKIEVEEEELKEEDAKNCGKKVENSAETEEDLTNTIAKAREIVYNGNSKAESSYITRADRLELGNNY